MSEARRLRREAERRASKLARKSANTIPQPQPSSAVPEVEPEPVEAPVAEPPTPRPVSAARVAANQQNAQRSTGPKSTVNSSQNHTIHGLARHNGAFRLLSSEDPLGFEALKQRLTDEHLPTTESESILVNAMAENHWLAARAQRLQDTCIDQASGVITDRQMASLYLRYHITHPRAFHKNLSDLLKLRTERRRADLGFEAHQMQKEKHSMQKNVHECIVHMKDTEILMEVCKYTDALLKATRENPGFGPAFRAEVQKKGFDLSHMEEAFLQAA